MSEEKAVVWRESPVFWGGVAILSILLGAIFYDGLVEMVRRWGSSKEYGYGYMIPPITLFLIWQRSDQLERIPFSGYWPGILIVLAGIGLFFVGTISSIIAITQYGFLCVLIGLVLAITGWQGLRPILVPLLFLAFMIPLPGFLFNTLSSKLQLISSILGVAVIRLFDISVYLEGNVIDLGTYKLQVAEACSGLRYLFPFMTLAFISAYFFQGAFWKKAILFISSLPITVLMNSFRIGVIGVLVEYGGSSQAEGFLHDFEGWVIFMACMTILLGEMWILAQIGKDKLPFRNAFGIDFPEPTPKDAEIRRRDLPRQFVVSILILLGTVAGASALDSRSEIIPQRADFVGFPNTVGKWQGKQNRIEKIYLDVLKVDDYIIMDYIDDKDAVVNFYVAYYASQRTGESAHSPRSCIPGGGWLIKDHAKRSIDGLTLAGKPLEVNRLLIKKGNYTQLVYYWFQQRNRTITNEYMVKWYLFWDALTRNRTDGSLIRLTTFLRPGESLNEGDKRISELARDIFPLLENYIPG